MSLAESDLTKLEPLLVSYRTLARFSQASFAQLVYMSKTLSTQEELLSDRSARSDSHRHRLFFRPKFRPRSHYNRLHIH